MLPPLVANGSSGHQPQRHRLFPGAPLERSSDATQPELSGPNTSGA